MYTDLTAAILVSTNNEFILQLRDDTPGILYPKEIILFGGHVEPNQTPEENIIEELHEEIELTITKSDLHFEYLIMNPIEEYDHQHKLHLYSVKNTEAKNLRIHEGDAIITIPINKPFTHPKLNKDTRQVLEKYKNGTIQV